MIKVIAKYLFLIFAMSLVFTSCQFNQSFKRQKYTRLNLSETNSESALMNDSLNSSRLNYQAVQFNSQAENSSSIEYFENSAEDTLVKMKDQIVPEIKNAIRHKQPIILVCASGRYLIKEPYYDSLTNFLCGVYTKEFKLNTGSTSYLELDYSESHCSDINKNCIQVKKIKSFARPVTIASTGISLLNPEQAIQDCIDLGIRIYLITPKGDYIVHEPKLDTSGTILEGRFVKIVNQRITPNLCLVLDKSAKKQIDSGYVKLSTITTMEDSSIDNIETKTAEEIRKEERNGTFALFFLLLGLLHIFLGVTFGSEVKNQLLREIVYMLFLVPAAIFLVLSLACLLIVLE